MPKAKIAVTIDEVVLSQVDALVREERFPSRSSAIEAAVVEQLTRTRRTRLAEACSRLDREEERTLAEEGLAEDLDTWPEY
ncbi:hypothetical protein BH23GEM4_BH23GEM4_14080 [soil metagenome]